MKLVGGRGEPHQGPARRRPHPLRGLRPPARPLRPSAARVPRSAPCCSGSSGPSVAIVWLVFRSPALDYRMVALVGPAAARRACVSGGPRVLHTLTGAVAGPGLVMLATRHRRLVRRRWLGIPIGMFLHLALDGVVHPTRSCSGGRSWAAASAARGLPELDRPWPVIVVLEVVGGGGLLVVLAHLRPRRRRRAGPCCSGRARSTARWSRRPDPTRVARRRPPQPGRPATSASTTPTKAGLITPRRRRTAAGRWPGPMSQSIQVCPSSTPHTVIDVHAGHRRGRSRPPGGSARPARWSRSGSVGADRHVELADVKTLTPRASSHHPCVEPQVGLAEEEVAPAGPRRRWPRPPGPGRCTRATRPSALAGLYSTKFSLTISSVVGGAAASTMAKSWAT